MALIPSSSSECVLFWCCGFAVTALLILCWIFTPPRAIRHLPCVPILPLLRSYLLREPENDRLERLIVPFADEKTEGIVVVWTLGRWMIHVIDHKLLVRVATAPHIFPKAYIPAGTMLRRFLGSSSVGQVNGHEWKKQSSHLQTAFAKPLPVHVFASLARNTFEVIEAAPSDTTTSFTVSWSDIAQNFALAAVGTSVIGYHFEALHARSPFVADYNQMLHDAVDPLYLVFPILEHLRPRPKVTAHVDGLRQKFQHLIDAKRSDPGDDIVTSWLKDPEMSQDTLLDNFAAFFIAGHVTTTGAMSSFVYYLAVHPHAQSKARNEVLHVLGPTGDPSVALMNPQSLPYLTACLRETLRINSPISMIVPRVSQTDFTLGKYYIPAGSQVVCNVYAVHHSKLNWNDPEIFRPERFLEGNKERQPWIPFSVGPRQCSGQNFAQYELRTLVAMLLRRYEWSLPEGSIHAYGIKNAISMFAAIIPKDLDITFKLLDGEQ